MDVKSVLAPQGPVAELVMKIAKQPVGGKGAKAAKEALAAEIPDFAQIVEKSRLGDLVGRLGRVADEVIAGEVGLAVLLELHRRIHAKGLRLSNHDLARCLERALTLRTSKGGRKFDAFRKGKLPRGVATMRRQGYINAFSGELRERVTQNLAEVRILVAELTDDVVTRAKAAGHKKIYKFDSGEVGDVRMPTSPASGSAPTLGALGPDRMFGFIVRDAKAKKGGFAGTIHVTAIVEIKARTGAIAGLNQTQKFIARASHGEVIVNGKRYRILVDEKRIKRTVLLPEDAIDRVQTMKFAKQQGINLLPYPAKIEDEITAAAKEVVDNLMQLDRLLR